MFKVGVLIFAAFVVAVSAGPMPTGPDESMSKEGLIYKEKTDLEDARKAQLHKIIENKFSTKQQIKDDLKLFFDQFGGDISKTYNEKEAEMEKKRIEMESKASEATSKLSDAAKQLISKLKAIHDNMSITPTQEREQIKAVFDKASDEVKNEIKSAKFLQRVYYFF